MMFRELGRNTCRHFQVAWAGYGARAVSTTLSYGSIATAEHTHQDSNHFAWTFLPFTAAATAAATGSSTSEASCDAKPVEEPAKPSAMARLERRTLFKYEKRLRQFSTHEKLYEYFSSVEKNGLKAMTASDVLRSLLAVYPPDDASWSRSGSLPGEPAPNVAHEMSDKAKAFLRNFDIDGDGAFSLDEFILFLVLLSMPLKDMEAIFTLMDADGSGTLDKEEFVTAIDSLRTLAGKCANTSTVHRSRCFECKDSSHEPFIDRWFGADGKDPLHLDGFMTFIVELHRIFDELEFSLLDTDSDGTISGLELARSLVAPASVKIIDTLLDRAEGMPLELRTARIDKATFDATQNIVSKYHRIGFALRFWQESGHSVDRVTAKRLMEKVCMCKIPNVVVDIFQAVFRDNQGEWDSSALHSALKGKYGHIAYSNGILHQTLLECFIGCVGPTQP